MISCQYVKRNEDVPDFEYVIPDTVNNEINKEFFLKLKNITYELNLRSIEKGVDSLEIRLWTLSRTTSGGEIFIIRKSTFNWNCYHYWFIENRSEIEDHINQSYNNSDISDVCIDTFWVNKEEPSIKWSLLISKLYRDDFLQNTGQNNNTQTGSVATEDNTFVIECSTKSMYKLLWYNCSDVANNPKECSRMTNFLKIFDSAFHFNNSVLGNYDCNF